MDSKDWLEKYRQLEQQSIKASLLPEGKRKTKLLQKLFDEERLLLRDPARPKQATYTMVQDRWALLVAACMVHSKTCPMWLAWIGNPIGDPPPTDCQSLIDAVADWQWAKRFETIDVFKPSSELLLSYTIPKPDEENAHPSKGTLDKALKGIPEEYRRKAGNTWIYSENAVQAYLAKEKKNWRHIG